VAPFFVVDAVCASLLRYPDRPPPEGYRLVPELATSQPTVSNGGKTYTFVLRRGFHFSTGTAILPRDAAHAFTRALSPGLESPLASLFTEIVGADAVLAGDASRPAGVTVRGRRIVVKLTRPVPDFPARTSALCVLPANLPIDREGIRAPAPTAGPYAISEYVPGRRVVLTRNRFYRGPRPRHVDRFVITLDNDEAAVLDQLERGAVDAGWVPNSVIGQRATALAARYGINRGRFFVKPGLFLRLLVLNTSRPLFKNNVQLRQAVNNAIDRRALLRARGTYAGAVTDQYLPPTFPGFRDARIYPLERPNVARARALARGRMRSRKVVFYGPDNPIGAVTGQIVRQNLGRIGLEVEIKLFPPRLLFQKLATLGEPFDIGWIGWLTSPPDPALLRFLFDGRTIGKPNFGNYSYFNSPRFNRLLDRASRLPGQARYHAFGAVDVDLARNAAPAVAYAYDNVLTLVGPRTGCVVFNPELELAAVCLR
jgi:ABC-type transport system substrate-binding protein